MKGEANALCFGRNLPGAGIPSYVEVTPDGLLLQLSGEPPDAAPHAIPFSIIKVGAGGFDHDQLVLTWVLHDSDRTLYLKDPSLIRAFRQAAPSELVPHLDHTARQVRQSRQWRRTFYLTAIVSLVGVLLLLWLGSDAMVKIVVDQIPVEWERQMGEAAMGQFLAGQTVVKDGAAVDAVQEITHRLAERIPNNPYTFQVKIVRSDVVNAFALPGGSLIVFTGLLKKAESPEEVAGVMSHELSHVLRRHALVRIVKTAGVVAVVSILLGESPTSGGLAKQLGVDLLTLKFSREQETEADVEGLRLLHRAKIAPDGMVRFFERLSDQDKLQVELLSTHPMSGGRAERIKSEIGALGKQEPVPFDFDWQKVQGAL